MVTKQIKVGRWFTLGASIIKIYDIVGDLVFVHIMSFDNGEYTEVCQWALHRSWFKLAKVYTPYQEEKADEEETV